MSNWQQELAQGFSNSKELLAFLGITSLDDMGKSEQLFRTKVPKGFAARMQAGNPKDPLLLQVLASHLEDEEIEGYVQDPLEEKKFNPLPGLIHKYQNRALLTLSGACAVHCRYCFRRHFPYDMNLPGKKGIHAIVDYLNQHDEINELIFSGGDPLLWNNHYYQYLLEALSDCSSLAIIRIHSRVPVVLPSRIEPTWLELWSNYPWQKVMVTHINHARELDASVKSAIVALKTDGWLVLNQSVLLKGVNDNCNVLKDLSNALFQYGILPYYLHLLDPVQGAAHFQISKEDALNLYSQLQRSLSGYLLPRLVQEIPGRPHKTPIFPNVD
jgi:EF-P beta-lysylation protein EpmB